jgi:glucans biosynthesis protein
VIGGRRSTIPTAWRSGSARASAFGDRWSTLRAVTNAFADTAPRGFGLLPRDRVFDHYQDDGMFYDRRPSAWVEPLGDWGPGSVDLVEIPTDDETNDNIVAFWRPANPVRAGDAFDFRYRLTWAGDGPTAVGVARVVSTQVGVGGRPGQSQAQQTNRLVVDFEGGGLAGLTRDSGVEPVVSAERGRIETAVAYPVVGTIRGQALSETWSYQLFNP